jgi:hypothetical protein
MRINGPVEGEEHANFSCKICYEDSWQHGRLIKCVLVSLSFSRFAVCRQCRPPPSSSVLASYSYPADRSRLRALLYPTVWRARARAGTSIGKTRVGERKGNEVTSNKVTSVDKIITNHYLSTVSFEVLENWAETHPDTVQIFVHFKIAGIFVTLSPHVFSSVRIYLS